MYCRVQINAAAFNCSQEIRALFLEALEKKKPRHLPKQFSVDYTYQFCKYSADENCFGTNASKRTD